MTDDNVRQLPSRKIKAAISIAANNPGAGGDQGSFLREPCGTCVSFKKNPAAGIGSGVCMFFPINAFLIPGPGGQPSITTFRTPVTATSEGCDQHDDGEDADGGEVEPVPEPSLIASGVGESRGVYRLEDHAAMEAIRLREERKGYKMSAALMTGGTLLATIFRENDGAPLTEKQLDDAADAASRFAEKLATRMLTTEA